METISNWRFTKRCPCGWEQEFSFREKHPKSPVSLCCSQCASILIHRGEDMTPYYEGALEVKLYPCNCSQHRGDWIPLNDMEVVA